jgi:hypothetical protein
MLNHTHRRRQYPRSLLLRLAVTIGMISAGWLTAVQTQPARVVIACAEHTDCSMPAYDAALQQLQAQDPGSGDLLYGVPVEVYAVALPGEGDDPVLVSDSGISDPDTANLDIALDSDALASVESSGYEAGGTVKFQIWVDPEADGDFEDSGVATNYVFPDDVDANCDRVLNQDTVQTDSGPLTNVSLVAQIDPVESSNSTFGTNPQIGDGVSDLNGHACISDDTLDSVFGGDPGQYIQGGEFGVDVFTVEADGSLTFAFHDTEYVGTGTVPDPQLAGTQLVDGSGNPITHTAVDVRIEPADTGGWPDGTQYPLVSATGSSTDAFGYIDAPLTDLTQYENSDYLDGDGQAAVDISTVDSDGNETFQASVPLYLGTGYDQVLETVFLQDETAGTPVRIVALPITSDSTSYGDGTEIGEGSTDESGDVIATVDTTPIINNSEYVTSNFIARAGVFVKDGDGNWQEQTETAYPVGGNEDPVMDEFNVTGSDGSAIEGVSVQIYADGTRLLSCPEEAGGCHEPPPLLMGTGTSGSGGELHVPLDLTGPLADPNDYVDDNGDVSLDIQYDANGDCDTDADPDCDDTPDWEEAFTSNQAEYVGYAYDAVLNAQTVVDSDGNPISGESIVAQALPQPGSTADPLTIGTGVTDSDGHPQIRLDETPIAGDANYQNQNDSAVEIAVDTPDAGALDAVLGLGPMDSEPQTFTVTVPTDGSASDCGSEDGGGCYVVAPLSAAQSSIIDLKEAVVAQLPTYPSAEQVKWARAQIGLAPDKFVALDPAAAGTALDGLNTQGCGAGANGHWCWVSMRKKVEADGGYTDPADYGNCFGSDNGIADPRNSHSGTWYANLCGPGSSEAVISHWNSRPSKYSGYFYYGALKSAQDHWYAYLFSLASAEIGSGGTYTTSTVEETDWVNREIGHTGLYAPDYCASPQDRKGCTDEFGTWEGDVSMDIDIFGYPLVNQVETCDRAQSNCLAGWPYRANHFQAISQDDLTDSWVKYGESANAVDTCGSGWADKAPGDYSGSFTDPDTHHVFTDNHGWDTDSQQFQFDRSLDLIR